MHFYSAEKLTLIFYFKHGQDTMQTHGQDAAEACS